MLLYAGEDYQIETVNPAPQYRVQSVFDALRLLETIVSAETGLNASELAAHLGESRNRVFRLLRTLEESGYIAQDESSRDYRPTLKLVSLGHVVSRTHNLEATARPIMEELRSRTGETVYLVGCEGDEAVALINLESSHLNRISAQPGRRWLLGMGAAGSAGLLALSPTQRAEFLKRHPEMRERFERATERYESDGVTFVDGRNHDIRDEGVMAIGAPIPTHVGGLRVALAVSWPNSRSSADFDTMQRMLLDSASALHRAFGGTASTPRRSAPSRSADDDRREVAATD